VMGWAVREPSWAQYLGLTYHHAETVVATA
jgi:hypothetical protein